MKKLIPFLFLLVVGYTLFSEENAMHNSCFIPAPENTEIYSIGDGNVVDQGYTSEKGVYVTVEYFDMGLIITYCNLKSSYVKKFEKITKGNIIGKVGYTGSVIESGVTLLFEIKENRFLFNQS